MQRMILGLLNGTEKPLLYNRSDTLTTAELLAELIEHNILDDSRPRKQLMATVLRACASLQRRQLLGGVYGRNYDHGPAITVEWSPPEAASPPAAC